MRSNSMHSSSEATAEVTIAAPAEFDEFYRANYRPVLRLAYTLSGSWPAAEDLAQETFAAAFGRWDEVGTYERADSWVRQVVVNKARSRLRRVYAETAARLRLRSETTYELPDSTQEFWESVRALPRQQAAAIALFYLEALTTEEIATILGCAPSTARVHLHNGRKTLAAQLGVEETL